MAFFFKRKNADSMSGRTRVVQALQSFIYVLQGMYREGPGSISNSLYWYQDGKLMNLSYELTDKELSFKPTDEFLELMNQLPPPSTSGSAPRS